MNELLKPLGFRRQGASWLRYEHPLLVRVSYYSSRWGGPGFIDLAFTVSRTELSKQGGGEWDAMDRIHNLIPSGNHIREKIKAELTPEEAEEIKKVLEKEAVPIFRRVVDPNEAFKLVSGCPGFLSREYFLRKLVEHCESLQRFDR